MVENNLNSVAEADPGYGQLFAILMRRKFWFLGVFLTALAISGVFTSRIKPTYKSSMQLQVEPNYQGKGNPADGKEAKFTDTNVEVDTATQLYLMTSSELAEQAVKILRAENKEYKDITVDDIKGALLVSQIKDTESNAVTKIFEAEYTANDPKKTQKVLDAMRRVYKDYNQEQQRMRLEKGLEFTNKKIPEARSSVIQAEANLERFRRTQGVTIDPESQGNAMRQALTNVEQERLVLRTQFNDAQARFATIQQQLQRTPQRALVETRLSQSTRYQTLLAEIQKTDLAIAQQRTTYTDEAEPVKKLLEQRQTQLSLLRQEVGRALGGQAGQIPASGENLLREGQLSQIDLTLTTQLAEVQSNLNALRARDESLAQKEVELRDQLKRFPALLAEYNRLLPEVQFRRERLQELLTAQQNLSLELSRGGFEWQVVEAPQPGQQTGPNHQQNIMLGAVLGFMLGGVAAFIRESIDDSVHTSAELEKQIALPLLGTTPKLQPAKSSEPVIKPFRQPEMGAPLTVQVLHSSPAWEVLDVIYKNIELLNSVSALKSLMLTSALPGEGKSTLALGLAMSAARLHKRVLLIDADLRHPSLHKRLNLPNDQGLSTLLASEINLPEQMSLQSLGSSYIDILTAGPTPSDPANLLSSPRMGQLMAAFEENYDLVIVDVPPVLGSVDAILTASFCQGVVLVARMGRVTRTELAEATTMLSKLNLIGVVANGGTNSARSYSPYTRQQRLALQQGMEI